MSKDDEKMVKAIADKKIESKKDNNIVGNCIGVSAILHIIIGSWIFPYISHFYNQYWWCTSLLFTVLILMILTWLLWAYILISIVIKHGEKNVKQ